MDTARWKRGRMNLGSWMPRRICVPSWRKDGWESNRPFSFVQEIGTVLATLTSQQFVNTMRYQLGTILCSSSSSHSSFFPSRQLHFPAGGMTSGVPPAAMDRTDTIGKIPAGSREIPHTNLEPSHSFSPQNGAGSVFHAAVRS